MLCGHWIKTIARFANTSPLFFTMDNYRQTPNQKHRHFVVVVALVVGDVVVVVEIVIVVVVGIAVVIVNVDLDIDIKHFCPLALHWHSGMGENLVPLTITGVTRKRKVAQ